MGSAKKWGQSKFYSSKFYSDPIFLLTPFFQRELADFFLQKQGGYLFG